jgi:hypothetical protein
VDRAVDIGDLTLRAVGVGWGLLLASVAFVLASAVLARKPTTRRHLLAVIGALTELIVALRGPQR